MAATVQRRANRQWEARFTTMQRYRQPTLSLCKMARVAAAAATARDRADLAERRPAARSTIWAASASRIVSLQPMARLAGLGGPRWLAVLRARAHRGAVARSSVPVAAFYHRTAFSVETRLPAALPVTSLPDEHFLTARLGTAGGFTTKPAR